MGELGEKPFLLSSSICLLRVLREFRLLQLSFPSKTLSSRFGSVVFCPKSLRVRVGSLVGGPRSINHGSDVVFFPTHFFRSETWNVLWIRDSCGRSSR